MAWRERAGAESAQARGRPPPSNRQTKAVWTLRRSFWIHAACYVVVAAVFVAVSAGTGVFVMKRPLLRVTVVLLGHGAALAVVELVTRYGDPRG